MDAPNRALQTSNALSSSQHFWWMAFLRCSKDYWWCCQQRGQCQDPRLVQVYQDFGDIYQYPSYLHWYAVHGVRLFDSPQVEMDFVKYLASGIEVLLPKELIKPRPGTICLAIPFNIQISALIDAVLQAFQAARIRGRHNVLDAKYRLQDYDPRSKKTLMGIYRTLGLKQCVGSSNASDRLHTWSGYQIGHQLQLSPRNEPQATDSHAVRLKKQSNVRQHVSRNLEACAELIANVEIGRFPSKDKVEQRARWTAMQQQELEAAVLSGQWQGRKWMAQEHAFMLPDHDLQLGGTTASRQGDVLSVLADFGNLDTPFLQPKRVRNNKPTTHGSIHSSSHA